MSQKPINTPWDSTSPNPSFYMDSRSPHAAFNNKFYPNSHMWPQGYPAFPYIMPYPVSTSHFASNVQNVGIISPTSIKPIGAMKVNISEIKPLQPSFPTEAEKIFTRTTESIEVCGTDSKKLFQLFGNIELMNTDRKRSIVINLPFNTFSGNNKLCAICGANEGFINQYPYCFPKPIKNESDTKDCDSFAKSHNIIFKNGNFCVNCKQAFEFVISTSNRPINEKSYDCFIKRIYDSCTNPNYQVNTEKESLKNGEYKIIYTRIIRTLIDSTGSIYVTHTIPTLKATNVRILSISYIKLYLIKDNQGKVYLTWK